MFWYVGPLAYTEEPIASEEIATMRAKTVRGSNPPRKQLGPNELPPPQYAWTMPARLSTRGGRMLDLRPFGSMANTNDSGGENHFAIVATDSRPGATPDGWTYLGGGNPGDVTLDTQQRQRIGTGAGITIESNSLSGAIHEAFVYKADPEGLTGPKPVMPSRHSRVTFRGLGRHRSLFVPIEWNRPEFKPYLDHIRKEYKHRLDGSQDDVKHRMWIAQFLDNHGINRAEFRNFQDPTTPPESPLDPQTPITESFPGTSGTLGGDLTWYEYDSNFQNVGGVGFKSGSAHGTARVEQDMSGGDMWVQNAINGGQNGWFGCAVRFASDAETCYWSYTRGGSAGNKHARITKRVAGTDSTLTDVIGSAFPNSDYNERLEIIGSNLELLANDETTSHLTVTDSSLSSANVRVGVSGRDSGGDAFVYDFQADVFAAAGNVVGMVTAAYMGAR